MCLVFMEVDAKLFFAKAQIPVDTPPETWKMAAMDYFCNV